MAVISLADILELSVAERVQLVENIWDSVSTEADAISLTPAQREELDHRLDDAEANPSVGRSWDEVKSRLPDSS